MILLLIKSSAFLIVSWLFLLITKDLVSKETSSLFGLLFLSLNTDLILSIIKRLFVPLPRVHPNFNFKKIVDFWLLILIYEFLSLIEKSLSAKPLANSNKAIIMRLWDLGALTVLRLATNSNKIPALIFCVSVGIYNNFRDKNLTMRGEKCFSMCLSSIALVVAQGHSFIFCTRAMIISLILSSPYWFLEKPTPYQEEKKIVVVKQLAQFLLVVIIFTIIEQFFCPMGHRPLLNLVNFIIVLRSLNMLLYPLWLVVFYFNDKFITEIRLSEDKGFLSGIIYVIALESPILNIVNLEV